MMKHTTLRKFLSKAALCSTMLLSATLLDANLAHAQQKLNSVEVLVNDIPISTHDINQRLRLVIAISGGVNSEEEFSRVREQVIQAMIDEEKNSQ